ncbi:MAG TPA: hypothetical protein VMH83_00815 [Candidatus Acidoferrum sp.]|nr:hypothetical protein [Candidatus Acidoferrum sp.]
MAKLSKLAIRIGFSLGLIGWCIAALGNKGLGIPVFCVSFIVLVLGMAYGAVYEAAAKMPNVSALGMRISVAGFCLSAIPMAIEIMVGSKAGFTEHYIFPVSIVLVVFGIAIQIYEQFNT